MSRPPKDYLPLEIRVFTIAEPSGHAGLPESYRVELSQPDSRVEASATVSFDRTALRALSADSRAYGKALGHALFADGVLGARFREMVAAIRAQKSRPRVRLRVDTPALQMLRWERVYYPQGSDWHPLGITAATPFSRYLPAESLEPIEPLSRRRLRLLAVMASPTGLECYGLSPIPDEERAALRSALSELQPAVEVTYLETGTALRPSQDQVRRALADGYDVVHFLCHGARTEGGSVLYLEDDSGAARPTPADWLAESFRSVQNTPLLCFLAACETAAGGHRAGFVPLAPSLVQSGHVGAVIAMTDRIGISTARLFTEQFYSRLLKHGMVDVAVNEARARVGDAWDWSVPVLFSRLPDNQIIAGDPLRRPFMAEDPPIDFVARRGVAEQAIAHLLTEPRGRGGKLTTALRGPGGYGKTTLARAICRDPRVEQAFDDGILWTRLGKNPGDLTPHVEDLIEFLTDKRPGFARVDAARAYLEELLVDRNILVVIDDVWNIADVRPFLQLAGRCARLITTRVNSALPPEAEIVVLDAMSQDEAVALLGNGLPPGDAQAFRALASRLGEWPLLLRLVNAALRYRVANYRQQLSEALRFVNTALDRHGLTAFDARDAVERDQAVAKTLEASFELLSQFELERFQELAIFPPGADTPLDAVGRLWKATGRLDEFDTEVLCDRLAQLSLLQHFDLAARSIRLHDVLRTYLEERQLGQLPVLHRRFLDQDRPPAWSDLPLGEVYLWRNLAHHLVMAGREEELRALLFDFDWLASKLTATDITSLIGDFRYVQDQQAAVSLQDALRLSAHVLATDKRQLAGQLLGRLSSDEAPEHQPLLTRARASGTALPRRAAGSGLRPRAPAPSANVALLPLTPTLTPPGSPLRGSLATGRERVRSLAITADGLRAASVATDRGIDVWDLERGARLFTLQGHTSNVVSLAFTPDGRLAVSGSYDRTVRVWDLEDGQELHTLLGHSKSVTGVAVTLDGSRAISTSLDATIRVWDLEAGLQAGPPWGGPTYYPIAVGVTPNGRRAVLAAENHTLEVWDLEGGDRLHRLRGPTEWAHAAAVTPDARRAVFASDDHTFTVWDLEDEPRRQTVHGPPHPVSSLAITGDGQGVVFAAPDYTVRVWDVERGGERQSFKGHLNAIVGVAVTAAGKRIVSAATDRVLNVWDMSRAAPPRATAGHGQAVTALALTPDGGRAVSASRDHTLKVWDVLSGTQLLTLCGHTGPVNAIALTSDGSRLVSASDDYSLMVWDLAAGSLLHTLRGHTGPVGLVALTPDDGLAVSAARSQMLCVWDVMSGTELRSFRAHDGRITALSITPDGRRAVSGSDDLTLKLWDLHSGCHLATLAGHTSPVTSVAVFAAGARAISSSEDSTLIIWDLPSGKRLRMLQGHAAAIQALTATPDHEQVLFGSKDGTVEIWDAAGGTRRFGRRHHGGAVLAVAVTPDGQWGVSASEDQAVTLWHLETGRPIASFTADSAIRTCAISPNRAVVVAGDDEGQVHVLSS